MHGAEATDMTVLCIDTSTTTLVVALLDSRDGHVLASGTSDARAQSVLAVIDEQLGGAVARESIESIVVGIGPGGFTGIRVGVVTARGLGEALGVPVHGVDSLLVLAASASWDEPGATVWAVLDARRGEWFVGPFGRDQTGRIERQIPAQLVPTSGVDAHVGNAVRVTGVPTVTGLAVAAWQTLADAPAGTGDPSLVLPNYGRSPDAEPARMELRVTSLDEGSLDALLAIEARCFTTPWSRSMYLEELRRPECDAVRLAAHDDAAGGRLLGAALAARIGDIWHVMNVLVDPAARRRGVARRLVDELLVRTETLGPADGWTLEVRAANLGAIRLYERAGFVNSGRRRGYYSDTGEDAVVMWRAADARVEVEVEDS